MNKEQESLVTDDIVNLIAAMLCDKNDVPKAAERLQKTFASLTNEAYRSGLCSVSASLQEIDRRANETKAEAFQMGNYIVKLQSDLDRAIPTMNEMLAYMDMAYNKAFVQGQQYGFDKEMQSLGVTAHLLDGDWER